MFGKFSPGVPGVPGVLAVSLSMLTVVLAACGSCSSSHGSGSGDDGGAEAAVEAGPGPSQACADFATAFCGRLAACTPFALQTAYGDEATCASRIAIACSPTFTASGTTATPSQMESCAQAVQNESCDEVLDNPQPSACDAPGTVGDAGACGAGGQCQSNYCKIGLGTVCGTCTDHVGAGSKCAVDADCSATLICAGGSCIGPAAAGADCSTTQPCLRSLTCIGGKCVTPVGLNGSCAAASDCDVAHGLYCNTQSKMCAQTQVALDGQPCGIVSNTLIACSGGATCANISQNQGTCHQPAADGAACGPGIGCMAPAVCTSTARCTLPNPSVCH